MTSRNRSTSQTHLCTYSSKEQLVDVVRCFAYSVNWHQPSALQSFEQQTLHMELAGQSSPVCKEQGMLAVAPGLALLQDCYKKLLLLSIRSSSSLECQFGQLTRGSDSLETERPQALATSMAPHMFHFSSFSPTNLAALSQVPPQTLPLLPRLGLFMFSKPLWPTAHLTLHPT